LTNEVASKTTHLPALHQVLTVKEPLPRIRRSPTPPRGPLPSRKVEPKEASATPAAIPDFDDLEDYVEDQAPPEDWLEDRLQEFEVVVEKPKKLETKGEAIIRWKEETNLTTDEARPIPE
jgi:hypothetical protein